MYEYVSVDHDLTIEPIGMLLFRVRNGGTMY